jgi:hypothetical protein
MSKIWRAKSARTGRYRDFSTRKEAVAEVFDQVDGHYIAGEESRDVNITINRTFDSDGKPNMRIDVDGYQFMDVYRTDEDYARSIKEAK